MGQSELLISLFKTWTISTWNEMVLQESIEFILKGKPLPHVREKPIKGGIIDFLVGTVGLECKVKSSKGAVMRQLSKYAESEEVTELLLVTTVASHRALDGITLQGKPVRVHWISPLRACW